MRENRRERRQPELPPRTLADGVRQREGLLIELFGDEVLRLHSKTWSLRQAAVNAIADTLPSLGVEPRQAAAACARAQQDGGGQDGAGVPRADAAPRAAVPAQRRRRHAARRAARRRPVRPRGAAREAHDANARARTQTADALLAASDASQLGAAAVAAVLVEMVDPKKGSSSQLRLSRLGPLRAIAEHGDEPRDVLPAAIELIKGALDHRDRAVRAK